jgi:flagellar hook assembly protein FlgD
VEDFTVIHSELPTEVATISLRIYDVKGRLIRYLVNNEPSGAQREVVWNGYDDEGQKARMGIYIVLLEGLNENGGSVYSAKGVVVLATKL